jgi:hypothetical protein
MAEDKQLESAGKSTVVGESIVQTPIKDESGAGGLPSGEPSLTKKRLFSEIETKEESNLFKPPLNDRFNSLIVS